MKTTVKDTARGFRTKPREIRTIQFKWSFHEGDEGTLLEWEKTAGLGNHQQLATLYRICSPSQTNHLICRSMESWGSCADMSDFSWRRRNPQHPNNRPQEVNRKCLLCTDGLRAAGVTEALLPVMFLRRKASSGSLESSTGNSVSLWRSCTLITSTHVHHGYLSTESPGSV